MPPVADVPPSDRRDVRIRTVLLPMCPTDGPMARRAKGGIPGNSLDQGFTSTSTLTHRMSGCLQCCNANKSQVVCVLYRSSGAPLLPPWLGKLEGTSLACNDLGQGSTSTNTLTHVWGAYGALRRYGAEGPPTCAADGRRELAVDVV